MARRRPARAAEPVSDLGPDIRRRRGDVVEHFRADPDNPNRDVKGARVRVAYHVLWIEGRISDEQHEAADRYLVRLEQAQGAVEGSPTLAVATRGHGGSGPTERQVMALADLRAADAVLGRDTALVRAVVGFNCTPDASEVPALRDAFQRLADMWGM
ncbi:MAG: hypothetical protein RLZZ187_2578 [Pseudomonadota bacterium]